MAKPKIFLVFGLLAIGSFFSWQFYQNGLVKVVVSQNAILYMPRKDKKKLSYLFYRMFVLDSGAYVLFGSKPMYMGGYFKPFSMKRDWKFFIDSILPNNIKRYQAWKTWQKYIHLMNNSPFMIKAEINPFFSPPHETVSILLINKTKFKEVVQAYRKDFEVVLSRSDVAGEFLLKEAKEKPLLKTILKNHNGLIGTLFGYGRGNAWLFEERDQGKEVLLEPFWGKEIYDYLRDRPDGMCLSDLSLTLGYPTFLADPNTTETKELRKIFIDARNRILNYYKGKDFLEATLGLLLEGPPSVGEKKSAR